MRKDANEDIIRRRLIDHLREVESDDTAFISEMCVDGFSRRADLVVANGRLSAFEIKSAADTLARLQGQLAVFAACFESVSVVCAEKHLDSVRKLLGGSRVGLLTVAPNGFITEVRKARHARITKSAWIGHLTVNQLLGCLRENGVPNARTKTDRSSLTRLALKLRYAQLRDYALGTLKTHNERMEKMRLQHRSETSERKALFASDPYN